MCVSNMNCIEGHVKVYDSIYKTAPKYANKLFVKHLGWLSFTNAKNITIDYVDVVRQKGNNDCGVFAIATALFKRKCPELMFWNQPCMRGHLASFFTKIHGNISSHY